MNLKQFLIKLFTSWKSKRDSKMKLKYGFHDEQSVFEKEVLKEEAKL